MLPPLRRPAKQCVPELFDRRIRRKRHYFGAHHFADKKDFQRIGGIFAGYVKSAARHFFGEDRTLQQQYGGPVRQHRRHQQRQKHIDVVRQFEREQNRREGRAHRPTSPRPAPMLTSSGPGNPLLPRRRNMASTPPKAAPIIRQRRENAPDVPEPSEMIQMADFTSSTPAITSRAEHLFLPRRLDRIASPPPAPAEIIIPPSPTEHAADSGPPHPMDRYFLEAVFRRVDAERQER